MQAGNLMTNQTHRPKKALYLLADDLVGWLSISDTTIENPVMQCDDEYYLHHDFYREYDPYGCFFVKSIADVNTPCINFIIYGHHMKDGSMFGNLDLYQAHPFISFDTLYEERTYQVMQYFCHRYIWSRKMY